MARLLREISSLRSSWQYLRGTDRRRCEPPSTAETQPHPKSLQVGVANPAAYLQVRDLDSPREERGLDSRLCSKQKKASSALAPTVWPTPAVSPTASLSSRFEALTQERDEGLQSSPNSCPEKHTENTGSNKHKGEGPVRALHQYECHQRRAASLGNWGLLAGGH